MKRLIILLFAALFMNASANNIKDNYDYTDRCAGLGYPLDKVIKLEKTIQKALKASDISLFADQFGYPFFEWVLVYPCEGSMCTSGIVGVYQSKDQQLQAIHFDQVIAFNFNLDMSKWYLYLDTSSFSQQKGKILMNFYNSRPAQVCSYLWQNNKVTLVHGNQSCFIH